MDDIRKYKHKVLLVTRVSLHGLIIVHFPDLIILDQLAFFFFFFFFFYKSQVIHEGGT